MLSSHNFLPLHPLRNTDKRERWKKFNSTHETSLLNKNDYVTKYKEKETDYENEEKKNVEYYVGDYFNQFEYYFLISLFSI